MRAFEHPGIAQIIEILAYGLGRYIEQACQRFDQNMALLLGKLNDFSVTFP